MKNIIVLIYVRIPEQLTIFLESFKRVNNSGKFNYTFILVENNIKYDIDGCVGETLDQYDCDVRFRFLKKIDEVIAKQPDLLVIADERCFCRNSSEDIFEKLIALDNGWQIYGTPINPTFPVMHAVNNFDIAQVYAHINFELAILNPKTMNTCNTEDADDLIPDDLNLYVDRALLNIKYNKKIIDAEFLSSDQCFAIDESSDAIRNICVDIFDIYAYRYEKNPLIQSRVFLDEYMQYATGNVLDKCKEIKKTTPPKSIIHQIHVDNLLKLHTANVVKISKMIKNE